VPIESRVPGPPPIQVVTVLSSEGTDPVVAGVNAGVRAYVPNPSNCGRFSDPNFEYLGQDALSSDEQRFFNWKFTNPELAKAFKQEMHDRSAIRDLVMRGSQIAGRPNESSTQNVRFDELRSLQSQVISCRADLAEMKAMISTLSAKVDLLILKNSQSSGRSSPTSHSSADSARSDSSIVKRLTKLTDGLRKSSKRAKPVVLGFESSNPMFKPGDEEETI